MMPQVVQQLDEGTPFVPRELAELDSEKISNWALKIRSAHVTGKKATPDNYMDVSCSNKVIIANQT